MQEEAGQQQSEECVGEMTAIAAQSTAPKRKSKDLERKEARDQQCATEHEERDYIHLFLMSLDPALS